MKNSRVAMKIGTNVHTKFAYSQMVKLKFDSEQEAFDFCDFVKTLDPENDNDVKEYNEVVQSIIDPEAVIAAAEILLKKQKAEELERINEIDERLSYKKGSIYFSKVPKFSMPEVMVDEIIRRHTNSIDLEPLFRFWMLTALNPNPEAREGLFRFITDLDLTLTEEGMFVAYRNVTVLNEKNKVLAEKLSEVWLDLMEDKDTKPKNVLLFSVSAKVKLVNDEYEYIDDLYLTVPRKEINKLDNYMEYFSKKLKKMSKELTLPGIARKIKKVKELNVENLGTVQAVYESMVEDAKTTPQYTDAHSRSMDISIGIPVQMPRESCDSSPDNSCSRGLHVGSRSFMRAHTFGSRGLVCLVNPRNVVAVPHEYGNGYKMRCCEYLPIAVAKYKDDGSIKEIDAETLSIQGMEYITEDIKNLKAMLDDDEFSEFQKHSIFPEDMGWIDVAAIQNNLVKFIESRTVQL